MSDDIFGDIKDSIVDLFGVKEEKTPENKPEWVLGKYDISIEGLAELASYEGISLKPYLDSGGVKTVGIGSTVSDIKDLPSWPWSKEISVEEAVRIYKKGLTKYIAAVNQELKVEIPQHKFDALVSITYNIGIGRHATKAQKGSGMKNSTFMARVNNRYSDAQIVSAMQRYNIDNGKVVQGLINRRMKESTLYTTGRYESGGKVPLITVNENHKPIYNKTIDILKYI